MEYLVESRPVKGKMLYLMTKKAVEIRAVRVTMYIYDDQISNIYDVDAVRLDEYGLDNFLEDYNDYIEYLRECAEERGIPLEKMAKMYILTETYMLYLPLHSFKPLSIIPEEDMKKIKEHPERYWVVFVYYEF